MKVISVSMGCFQFLFMGQGASELLVTSDGRGAKVKQIALYIIFQ